MIASLRIILGRRRLQRMVDRNRNSFAVRDFAKRRAAALKHYRRELAP